MNRSQPCSQASIAWHRPRRDGAYCATDVFSGSSSGWGPKRDLEGLRGGWLTSISGVSDIGGWRII
eukprot:8601130-Alexandrium_andersonii.AAC.1